MIDRSIPEQVRAYIRSNFLFGDAVRPLREEDSFLQMGIIDSTGIIELVTFLQETFLISVEDQELIPANLDSISNIVRFVERKKGSLAKTS